MPTLINRSINLDQTKRFNDTIFLTQGEGGATTLNFTLMQGGVPIDLTGCAVSFLAKKPSGATLTNACTLTNAAQGKAAYVVTTQTAIEAGSLTDARLEVLKSGVAWKSFKFPVTVEAVPDYTTAIQSTNEFTVLQSLTSQIAAHTTAIGTLASLLTTSKTNLVAAINELFTSKADAPTSGTWTPVIFGTLAAGTNTYATRAGTYYRIGKMVFAEFAIELSALGGTISGQTRIGGLPFAVVPGKRSSVTFDLLGGITLASGKTSLTGTVIGSDVAIYQFGSNTSLALLPVTGLSASLVIKGMIIYESA